MQSSWKTLGSVAAVVTALISTACTARAQVIAPFYAGSYSFVSLGTPSGVPGPLGGLTLQAGNPNNLLIGGSANSFNADIFQIGLTRSNIGGLNRITGFSGSASFFADANGSSGGIDGGLAYGPGNVLFYTSFSDNRLGQIKPGSTSPDKLIDLTPLGIGSSVGTLQFVPTGSPGAGRFKIASYSTGNWYDVTLTADGTGTYNINTVSAPINIGGGPEGIIYVPAGSPLFTNAAILVSEYGNGVIAAYDVDGNGDPLLGTRRVFMTGLTGAEGAYLDPTTGDFLFSTFGGGNQVISVRGFAAIQPGTAAPEPGTVALIVVGIPLLGLAIRRRKA
jgi:hypothetical protein